MVRDDDASKEELNGHPPSYELLGTAKILLADAKETWKSFSEKTGDSSPASLKRNIESWLEKINKKVEKIGYRAHFVKNQE